MPCFPKNEFPDILPYSCPVIRGFGQSFKAQLVQRGKDSVIRAINLLPIGKIRWDVEPNDIPHLMKTFFLSKPSPSFASVSFMARN